MSSNDEISIGFSMWGVFVAVLFVAGVYINSIPFWVLWGIGFFIFMVIGFAKGGTLATPGGLMSGGVKRLMNKLL